MIEKIASYLLIKHSIRVYSITNKCRKMPIFLESLLKWVLEIL